MKIIQFLKNWTLPVAIVVGASLYLIFDLLPSLDGAAKTFGPIFDFLFPLSVFFTLFITFSKVDFHKMRPVSWHGIVLLAQILLVSLICGVIYLLGNEPSSEKLVLEAILTCVIGPCASAAPVVTAKLGGNLNSMTTFTLISSMIAAVTIPLVFPLLEKESQISFLEAFWIILQRLIIVLLLPLFLGWLVRHYLKHFHDWIVAHPNWGFYCWAFSLAITTGITTKNILHSEANSTLLLLIALLSLVICFIQFCIGRAIGHVYGEKICTGQAMFQKNTALAIWVSYMYLTPVASIGAGCYVLWQNIINSWELWDLRRNSN